MQIKVQISKNANSKVDFSILCNHVMFISLYFITYQMLVIEAALQHVCLTLLCNSCILKSLNAYLRVHFYCPLLQLPIQQLKIPYCTIFPFLI